MSMSSWTEPGYGFELFNGDNWGDVVKFIINHNNGRYDLSGLDLKEAMELEDEYELEDIMGEPVSWVVAQLINDTENVTYFKGYQSCGDTDQETMIGIEPCYPWQTQYHSKETIDAMLNRYAKELGITDEPNYFEAKYFG